VPGPRAELAPEPHTSFAESASRVLRLRGDPVNVTRRHHRLTGIRTSDRIISMFTAMARSLLSTEDSIATPCSVNAYGA
jgi:hypothetical protein